MRGRGVANFLSLGALVGLRHAGVCAQLFHLLLLRVKNHFDLRLLRVGQFEIFRQRVKVHARAHAAGRGAGNIDQASSGVRDSNERVAQTVTVSKSMAQDLTGINAAVTENRANEEQNACYAAIEDTLACYTDRYGPPAPGVRVVPHLLSVTEKECGFTRIADELGF